MSLKQHDWYNTVPSYANPTSHSTYIQPSGDDVGMYVSALCPRHGENNIHCHLKLSRPRKVMRISGYSALRKEYLNQ